MEYFITRDKDGFLALWNSNEVPPKRYNNSFIPNDGTYNWYMISSRLFPKVTWENSPRKVKIELIKE